MANGPSLHSSALGGSLGAGGLWAVAGLCANGPPRTSLLGGRAAVQTIPSPPHSAGDVAGLVGSDRADGPVPRDLVAALGHQSPECPQWGSAPEAPVMATLFKGAALCWRLRCPGAAKRQRVSAHPGLGRAPTRTTLSSALSRSLSTTSPLGFLITITNWAWKVVISQASAPIILLWPWLSASPGPWLSACRDAQPKALLLLAHFIWKSRWSTGHCPWSPSTAGPTWSPGTVIPSTSSLASNTFSSLNFSPAAGRPGVPRDALVHLLLEGLHALAGGFGGRGPVELLPSFGQLSWRLGGLGQDHFEWLPQGSPSRSPWSPLVSFLIASLVFRVSDSMVLYLLLASWPHLRTFFFFNIFFHFFVFG